MKQINSIFSFSQTYYWFDGEGVYYESIEVFEDGSISTIDFADERIPTEIKKEWKSNEKLAEEIKHILDRFSGVLDYYDYEDYEKLIIPENLSLIANLIEEVYRFNSFNKEIAFHYKCNNISSECFIKKAPFTLLVKQIQEKIKLEYPEFEMISVQ